MRFKIDWDSLIVGRKFTALALFYFVFEGNFPSTSPWGLIFGGAYFRNFTVYIFRYLEVCEILRKSKGTINIRFSLIFRTFSGVFPLFKRARNQTIQC